MVEVFQQPVKVVADYAQLVWYPEGRDGVAFICALRESGEDRGMTREEGSVDVVCCVVNVEDEIAVVEPVNGMSLVEDGHDGTCARSRRKEEVEAEKGRRGGAGVG